MIEKIPSCVRCGDSGWVELLGTDKDGYELGATGCRWCDPGKRILVRRTFLPRTYRTEDVASPIWMPPHEKPAAA